MTIKVYITTERIWSVPINVLKRFWRISKMINYAQVQELLYFFPNWSIFPVNLTQGDGKVEKRPALSWKEYMTRRPTDEELHTWFDTPKYNAIGLATGQISGVVVVDLDSDKIPDGFVLDSPLVSKTISGGRHFFYRWDEEMRNDAKVEGLPIDFRGDGGFVVIPPSALGDKGYVWDSEHNLCPEFMLDPLPQDIKDVLKGRKYQGLPPVASPEAPGLHKAVKVAYDVPINLSMPPAGKGERNVRATEYSGKILRQLSPDQWETFGWPELCRWNQGNDPPLSERELRTTWQSVQHKELIRRESQPIVGPVAKITKEVNDSLPDKAEKYKDSNNTYMGSVFVGADASKMYQDLEKLYGSGISTGYNELDYFFKFLPEQLYMISAQTHVGKSTFALNICGRVAKLGHRVLFCSLEQGIFIEPRIRSMLGGEFPDTLGILTTDKMLAVSQLVQIIEQSNFKPELICVDHLHFLKKSGRGQTEDIDEIVLTLQNMAKTLSLPVIVISHTRKLNTDKAPDLDDLKDSSSLSQVPGVVIILHRKRNDIKNAYNSILSNDGTIIIGKNRIQGRTGAREFTLEPSGNIVIKSVTPFAVKRLVEDMEDSEVETLFR
jgi:hypothetical protein